MSFTVLISSSTSVLVIMFMVFCSSLYLVLLFLLVLLLDLTLRCLIPRSRIRHILHYRSITQLSHDLGNHTLPEVFHLLRFWRLMSNNVFRFWIWKGSTSLCLLGDYRNSKIFLRSGRFPGSALSFFEMSHIPWYSTSLKRASLIYGRALLKLWPHLTSIHSRKNLRSIWLQR